VTSPVPLSPGARLAVPPKEGFSRFGPPRDGFGFLAGLLDGGEQRPGQSLQGQGIGAGRHHQFAELRLLPLLKGDGLFPQCLDLPIEALS